MPAAPVPLIDSFDRRVKDLRISITDRCNFRCTYCMPAEGMQWLPRDELLTYEEQARIARVCVERFGFEAIRITGGEPTLRAHLPRLIGMLAPLDVDLALTSNGVKLPEMAHDLAAAGLRRINVSLDSLRPDTFKALTRRDDLERVLAGVDAALDAGLDPVKINCVVIRGVNDDEIVDLAAYGRAKGVGLRFIEFMPLDAEGTWSVDQVVPAREILDRVDAAFPLETEVAPGDTEPATRYRYRDRAGDVGVIPSVTEPFCDNCDRVRVTAEGKFRTCLFALDEFDLRAILRDGDDAGDAERGRSDRRQTRGRDRAGRRDEVGGTPHRAGQFRAPLPVHEPDRRVARTLAVVSASEFTHLDPLGRARMVDVSSKEATHRRAVARCRVYMEPETTSKIAAGAISKGDVFAVARVAGIQAAKQTPNLLPLCHPLLVGSVFVNFRIEDSHVEVEAQVDTVDRTGVEMEALTACAVAALTIYDMCKSIDRSMTIGELTLWEKTGGRSGMYRRPAAPRIDDELGI